MSFETPETVDTLATSERVDRPETVERIETFGVGGRVETPERVGVAAQQHANKINNISLSTLSTISTVSLPHVYHARARVNCKNSTPTEERTWKRN